MKVRERSKSISGHNVFLEKETAQNPSISLQGKYPLAEVIKEVFSVIKLAKFFKKTYATTSVSGNGVFGGAFNGNSTQLKKNGWPEVITDVFSIGALIRFERTDPYL